MMKYGYNELKKPRSLNIRWMRLYNSVPSPPSEKKSKIITSMKRIDGPSSPSSRALALSLGPPIRCLRIRGVSC